MKSLTLKFHTTNPFYLLKKQQNTTPINTEYFIFECAVFYGTNVICYYSYVVTIY